MKKRIVAMILLMVITVGGCGHENSNDDKTLAKKDVKQEEVKVEKEEAEKAEDERDVINEVVADENVEEPATPTVSVEHEQTEETRKVAKKIETKTETVAPAVREPVDTTPEVKSCEHKWQQEEFYYDIFKKVTFGCNGCGLALFEWSDDRSSVEHIENLYFHEPCPTDRFLEPCSGGGYHNESVTIGFCGLCSSGVDDPEGRVAYRQCMWTEMGKRCSKNEVAGTYEKVEFDQNHFMYYDSCKCQRNMIFVNGRDDDRENGGKGIIFGKEKCTICGIYKEN